MPDGSALEVLVAGELVRYEEGWVRTTRRWQAAMARAAARLQQSAAPWTDLRLPIAAALVENYPCMTDEALAPLVEAMLPVEEAELERAGLGSSPRGFPDAQLGDAADS